MAITEEQLKKVKYLRESVRLQSPDTVNLDPDYKFTDEELYSILETVTPAHNPGYTLGDLPSNQFYFVILLAKKEIFYRLASTTAPFYPLSAEGAKLEKNVRFDHYLALIKVIMEEYEAMKELSSEGDAGGSGGTIQTYQASLLGQGKTYYGRYVTLTEEPFVELELSGITQTSVNVDWTKYDVTIDTNFLRYSVFISTTPVYDEYSVKPIDPALKSNYSIEDVRRTKIRISDLIPDTEYFVLVRTENKFGISGYAQKSFRTEAEVVIDAPIGS